MDIRVTLFEDNTLVREALQAILNGTPGFTCSGAFTNGLQWQAAIARSSPHVVLVDIEMPGIDGIALTSLLTSHFQGLPVLIQTVFNDNEKIFKALCAGASGYVLKTDAPHKLLEAIAQVYHGDAFISPAIAKNILRFFTSQQVILVCPVEGDSNISAKEKEILSLMMQGHDYKAIAALQFISYHTVRTHAKNIYKKLHVTSRNAAVMKAMQQGFGV